MNLIEEPLIFTPIYKDYLWGGDKIANHFHRRGTPERCAESWEISAHPDGMSVVAEGTYQGLTLSGLTKMFGTDLIGTLAPRSDSFPLLFKIIDARRRLSVQVHPSNSEASRSGAQPKTEMWYILDCEQGASLFAGLAVGATRESMEEAIRNGSVAEQLAELSLYPDHSLFIPGGMVHAIGEGSLIYEVQQSSNTTYRVFDWNRTDIKGVPRALHIQESLSTIDWNLPPSSMTRPTAKLKSDGAEWSNLVNCEFFKTEKLYLTGSTEILHNKESFSALFVSDGRATLSSGGRSVKLKKGSSALIPAAAESYHITTEDPSTILISTL